MGFAQDAAASAVNQANGGSAVIPVDFGQFKSFSDFPVEEQGTKRRNDMLRPICEAGVAAQWDDDIIQPLLAPKGGYAGNSNFAHGIICERVYRAEQERFDAVGDVTLAELWPLIHVVFKKRKLVFERGFVAGIRTSLT